MTDDESEFEGPEFEGPEFEGPEFEGPEFEGPEFEGPEFEGPEEEISPEEEFERELEEEFQKDLEQETKLNDENDIVEIPPLELIKIKTQQLATDESLKEEDKTRLNIEIKDLLLSVGKQSEIIKEIEKPDPEYNEYNFARSAAILSFEYSWSKIKLKLNHLKELVQESPLDFKKTITLNDIFDRFERQCINEIIHSKKPNNKIENNNFEAELFDQIVTLLPKIYSGFFDAILGSVSFEYGETPWLKKKKSTEKFRAYVLDLRNKKEQDMKSNKTHKPNYKKCNMNNGLALSKKDERGSLYQGYWQVEFMILELRNHTEHWVKEENKPFLENELNRMMEDPISGIESPGNFFILISLILLMSYHFIDVMQTWVDTVKLLEK